MKFVEFSQLTERFLNAVGNSESSVAIRNKYKDEAFSILQSSYAKIGGIKGNGFASADEMAAKIPFWKLGVRDGEVKAVAMYKDKAGRKLVASGTDQTPEGVAMYKDMVKNDLQRAFGEKSKAALGTIMKEIPWTVLKDYTFTPKEAQAALGDDITPIKSVPEDQWPDDAAFTISKFPQLIDYGYLHEVGEGNILFKVMFGTAGNKIK